MSQPAASSELSAELHQLLVAAVLGAATATQIARLNALLRSDTQLRHEAARFLEEEAVLRREFTMLDRVVDFHKLPLKPAGNVAGPPPQGMVCRGTVWQQLRQRLFLAVALLLSLSIAVLALKQATPTSDSEFASDTHAAALPLGDGMELAAANQHPLPIAASILTPVTHVSWSGPQFATWPASDPPTAKIREGVVSFTSAFGRPAKGYVLCLPPGALLDVVAAGDAEGENALAVIEFDAYGRPTGQRVSFSNSAGEGPVNSPLDPQVSPMTKKGRLGVCTQRNDGTSPRYYLFTGVHKLLNRSADDSWHVSKLAAFVEEPGLLHLGWDDSGMPAPGDCDLVQHPDNDFDDVTATIRLTDPAQASLRTSAIRFYSKSAVEPLSTEPSAVSDRYQFSVAPGQVAIVKVCSRSGAPVELSVVEKDSGRLRWQCIKKDATSPNLGVCAIENRTSQPQTYCLVGRKLQPENAANSGAVLKHSVLFEQEQFVTVGFDDGDQLATDFYKVRVDILTMDQL